MCIFNTTGPYYPWLVNAAKSFCELSEEEQLNEIRNNPSLTKMQDVVLQNLKARRLASLLLGRETIVRMHNLDLLVAYHWFGGMTEYAIIRHMELTWKQEGLIPHSTEGLVSKILDKAIREKSTMAEIKEAMCSYGLSPKKTRRPITYDLPDTITPEQIRKEIILLTNYLYTFRQTKMIV